MEAEIENVVAKGGKVNIAFFHRSVKIKAKKKNGLWNKL